MKKRLWKNILFAALLSLPAVSFAQNSVADSLARLLEKAPPDTHRISLLVNLAWEINELDTDKAAALLNEAVALAQKLNFPKGEAAAWNSLGVVEEIRGNLPLAQQFYLKALAIRRRLGDLRDIGNSLNNLGVAYEMQGRFDSAVIAYRENLDIQKQLRDTLKIARVLFNMAAARQEEGLYPEAHSDLLEARLVFEALGDQEAVAKVYSGLGHLQFELEIYDSALVWYRRALQLREKLDNPGRLAEALSDYANALDETDSSKLAIAHYQRALGIWEKLEDLPGQAQVYTNLGDAYKHTGDYPTALRYLQMAEDICLSLNDNQALMEVYNTIGDVHGRAGRFNLALDYTRKYYAIAQESGDGKYIQSAYKDFAEVYSAKGDFAKAYKWRVQYDELKYRRMNEKIGLNFARKEAHFADEKKQRQIEDQKRELRVRDAELAVRDAELAAGRIEKLALLGGVIAFLLLAALLFNRNRIRARANRELAAKNAIIQQERERADALLKNILPEKTAEELKAKNTVQPVRYESVTVMFTDFKNFTRIAEGISPEELIAMLDDCFRLFDSIVKKHGLEKIKTIGDAYMCAGGLPVPNDTHPVDTVNAALEMQRELSLLMSQKVAEGKPIFEMRIGIHTGPVVAGVVGSHKFAYDIWGDTVNTAARLEQSGEPGKVNISETTYREIKSTFDCTFRGKLAAKNKGEIEMYFVNG